MLPRFFAPALSAGDGTLVLPPDEARHLAKVLRLRPGDELRVFNGRGFECRAVVAQTAGHRVTVRVIEPAAAAAESPLRLTLAQGVLAGDKMDAVVRDVTALGASVVQPIVTARSETSLARLARTERVARWQRVAVASAKQCGRAVVPAVAEPLGLQEWLRRDTSSLRLILTEPAGDAVAGVPGALGGLQQGEARSVSLLIGPEGGWTAEEAAMAGRAGFVPWTLGGRTLRADVAPLVAAAILQFVHGDLGPRLRAACEARDEAGMLRE